MLMQPGPVVDAVRAIEKPGRILFLSPSGRPLDGGLAAELGREENITLICGRYEGVDSRISHSLPLEEVSVGEAILNGGETAALAVVESVSRFLPGFLGAEESAVQESFSEGLLEYEQFTRPEIFEGQAVPPVLLSGNHAEIASWRRRNSLVRTLKRRPDLLAGASLDRKDAAMLADQSSARPGRNLAFCLMHYPVRLENGKTGVSSLTNLDIHDIARISRSYGMLVFYVLTPLQDQIALLDKILAHWLDSAKADRARALSLVRPVSRIEEVTADCIDLHGTGPEYIVTSAQWPAKAPLAPAKVLEICRKKPVIICLGTARGLARNAIPEARQLRPLRFLDDNHLSVRCAAAIIADRILGDFY